MGESPIVESWEIHNRIHLYLLEAVSETALASVSASKGRTVAEQFAHIHNVRLMWLKAAAPVLLEGLAKIEKDDIDKAWLAKSLEASSKAIAELLRQAAANGDRVKNFKPHGTAFFAYLIAHESHHRGQIALTLKQAGHPLEKKIAYGIWEWGVR